MRSLLETLKNTAIVEAVHDEDSLDQLSTELNENIIFSKPIILDEKVMRKCAGYIIEGYVINTVNSIKDTTVPESNSWYDFEFEGDKFEVKAFEKGKKYSNTKITKNQSEHKDELVFVLVEYEVHGTDLSVNNIELIDGTKLIFRNNRLVKK